MQAISKTVSDIRTDDVLAAMARDSASDQFVQARIAEIVEGSLGLGASPSSYLLPPPLAHSITSERERALQQALGKLSKKTVELNALRCARCRCSVIVLECGSNLLV